MANELTQASLAAYAGRWLALVGDQIAGVGDTPAAAAQLAHANRPRERLRLHYVDRLDGEPLPLPLLLVALRPYLTRQPVPIYLVGGAVRDLLLDRPSPDLDFVVPQDATKLAYRLANQLGQPAYTLDKTRDTGRVVLTDHEATLDLARFRGADLAADLLDRDFTVNAMALPANATTTASLIDPAGGQADLAAGLIREVQPGAIARDPIRALRALRQAHSLGFQLAPETATAVRAAVALLPQTSAERIRDEWLKLLIKAPAAGVADLSEMGLLPAFLPELAALTGVAQSPPHHEPVLAHTISVLRWLERIETAVVHQQEPDGEPLALARETLATHAAALAAHLARPVDGQLDGRTLFYLGALFHDVGKAETQTVEGDGRIRFWGHARAGAELAAARLTVLCLSKKAVTHVSSIVAGHMRPLLLLNARQPVSRRAVYRFFRDMDTAGLDIGLLALADHLATHDGSGDGDGWSRLVALVAELYDHYFERQAETVSPSLLLDGRAVMAALDLAPGPEVGRLLRLLEEAQAAGEVSTEAEALAFVRQQKSSST